MGINNKKICEKTNKIFISAAFQSGMGINNKKNYEKANKIFILDAFQSGMSPLIAKFLWEKTELIDKKPYIRFVFSYGEFLNMKNLIIQWQHIKSVNNI